VPDKVGVTCAGAVLCTAIGGGLGGSAVVTGELGTVEVTGGWVTTGARVVGGGGVTADGLVGGGA
jgi:hypothetical protein